MAFISIPTFFVHMFVLFLISNAVDKHVHQSTRGNSPTVPLIVRPHVG